MACVIMFSLAIWRATSRKVQCQCRGQAGVSAPAPTKQCNRRPTPLCISVSPRQFQAASKSKGRTARAPISSPAATPHQRAPDRDTAAIFGALSANGDRAEHPCPPAPQPWPASSHVALHCILRWRWGHSTRLIGARDELGAWALPRASPSLLRWGGCCPSHPGSRIVHVADDVCSMSWGS